MALNIVEEFEKVFAEKIGVSPENAIAVNSGSAALLAVLKSLDLKSDDEVITTPFTFIATANAIIHASGRPVFADIDPFTLLLDPESVNSKISARTKAIIPVHLFGKVCDLNYNVNNIVVIEDCAQALGARFPNGNSVGTIGDAGCFSFYKTKNLSTFEGGMLISNRLDTKKIRSIINHGDTGNRNYEYLGYNLRMAEPLALLGLHAIEKHWHGTMAELGRYGPENGYYPEVIYNTPIYRKMGIKGDCPNAEKIAKKVKDWYTRNG